MNFKKQEKLKAITFSYDDGTTQDIRLIELLNKYNLKSTFNINSELLANRGVLVRNNKRISHYKLFPEDVKRIYEGHEVAVHTLTHPNLTKCDDQEIIRQVELDRQNLSQLVGYEVVGMAYPCGGVNNNDHIAEIIKNNTAIKYSRTITTTGRFDIQENLYRFNPTVYHHVEMDLAFRMAEEFINLKTDTPKVFYIWGHAYEFDIYGNWDRMEELCKLISGRDDIFYGTNREVLLNTDWD